MILFQSTLPSRGATVSRVTLMVDDEFQSTLPSRGATILDHAVQGGGDISIHAPLAGSDAERLQGPDILLRFQSTLPSRGATLPHVQIQVLVRISIHAPLAGSDLLSSPQSYSMLISIHAPLAGSDTAIICDGSIRSGFQSTLPSRGATADIDKNVSANLYISDKFQSNYSSPERQTDHIATVTLRKKDSFRCEPPGLFMSSAASHR